MTGAPAFGKATVRPDSRARKAIVTITLRMVAAEIWGTVVSFSPGLANFSTTPQGARQGGSRDKRSRSN
jgi:hypothetical protein